MSLVLFTAGTFGDAVASRIAERIRAVRVFALPRREEALEELLEGAGFVGVTLWRRYPRECDALDAACARREIPWSTAVLEGQRLLAGPLISPGRGPCYACYRRRWLTHVAVLDREQALEEAYATDANLGPRGFLSIAAALAASGLLLDRREHERAPGRLREVDLLNGSVQEARVVRVHGCPRCSSTRHGKRYVSWLVPAVRHMLP